MHEGVSLSTAFALVAGALEGYAPSFSSHVRWCDRISCYAALDIAACADFIEEIRMKCADAKNLDRKSGKHGAPVQGSGPLLFLT
jgi:hypothetical protein